MYSYNYRAQLQAHSSNKRGNDMHCCGAWGTHQNEPSTISTKWRAWVVLAWFPDVITTGVAASLNDFDAQGHVCHLRMCRDSVEAALAITCPGSAAKEEREEQGPNDVLEELGVLPHWAPVEWLLCLAEH